MGDEAENIADLLSAEAPELESVPKNPEADGEGNNLDLIMDIPLRVTVEMGCSRIVLSELLQLGQGSVL